ncbi:hypothetical protein [Sphingomonas yabuuchiae]|uniref:hypothetical protein n=1 Tax=Sphingomonas yabuuchiae TaxID=172044 RepID=UPI003375FE08
MSSVSSTGNRIAPGAAWRLALYRSESLSAVERLRAYAIRHRRGFTIDAQIQAPGGSRWMRIVGAPQCRGKHVVALHGLKFDVSGEYR